jgi:hypothetical protein
MLSEVVYKHGVEIQNYLSICLKREIFYHLETLQKSFESYFCLDDIKIENGFAVLFFLI